MYRNYGDKNFFEYGVLVDDEHSDTEYDILWCMPFSDKEGMFLYAKCRVDISDSWIDRDTVMQYCGIDENSFDPIQFAISCIDYYGVENFSDPYDGYEHDREYIKNRLKNFLIANDGLDITW